MRSGYVASLFLWYLSFHKDKTVSDAMIGDTNLFFNNPQEPHVAEIEIMIAHLASRGKRRGWESVILMIYYGNFSKRK